MLRVLNFIKDFPEVDKIEIFQANIYYESMLPYNCKDELTTKDEIIAKVLKVTQSYPKAANYKVTEETHFCNNLGFDKQDLFEIIQGLQVEFKLDIPDDIDSCKLAIQYIYDHRMEKLSREEFQKRLIITEDSGRRIYLRAGEMGMPDSGRGIQSRETNWDACRPEYRNGSVCGEKMYTTSD
jgi:acyl carrier protein